MQMEAFMESRAQLLVFASVSSIFTLTRVLFFKDLAHHPIFLISIGQISRSQ